MPSFARSAAITSAIALAGALSCSLRDVSDLDQETNIDGGGSGVEGGAADCTAACGDPACPCPSVEQVAVTTAAGAYRIDTIEVTAAEYRRWLAARPSTSGQRAECAWNTSYEPGVISPSASQALPDLAAQASSACADLCTADEDAMPIVCVDWCDAAAYCAWAKKHLCGKIGAANQGLRTVDITGTGAGPFADPTVSEWYAACAGPARATYPYGTGYVSGRCNDAQVCYQRGRSLTQCVSAVGAFDLSGNVSEWEDACERRTDPNVQVSLPCLRRGGAFWQDSTALACDGLDLSARSIPSRGTGFRCCADPR